MENQSDDANWLGPHDEISAVKGGDTSTES